MVNNILETCQRIRFELNLFQLLEVLAILVMITVVVFLQRKILNMVRKESMIDARLMETSARIVRVVAEIEESKEIVSNNDSSNLTMQTQSNINEESFEESLKGQEKGQDQAAEVITGNSAKIKKTRAMSMEERWADFEKKRAVSNTA